MYTMKCLFALIVVYSTILIISVDCGSCLESALCCNGRDSSCVVQKAPVNSIIEDLNDKPCYCDHACLKLGDCCSDFKQYCGGEYQIKLLNEYTKVLQFSDFIHFYNMKSDII